MKSVQLIQILFLSLFGLNAHAQLSGPTQVVPTQVIHTQNGDVRGLKQEIRDAIDHNIVLGQVESFKALPYAAPPVGDFRWKPPEEPSNWTGTRDAFNFFPECPQIRQPRGGPSSGSIINGKSSGGIVSGSEDCLYLNVFKPAGSAGALPVIVFIHGGSNISGSTSETSPNEVVIYDGSRMALAGNVVVVTLNYRLAALGFIGHKGLSATSGYGRSGNYGYMDQNQALKWVQRNIAAFGGDATNVTLLGHSAGAKSVWVHITSPLSTGLFHRAIVHSAIRENARPFTDAEQVGKELAQNLNCSNASDQLELACMRSKSANEIVSAMPGSVRGAGKYFAVVDNKVLTGSPIPIINSGQHNHVPILEGNVEEETSLLNEDVSKNIKNEGDFKAVIEQTFASALAAKVLAQYPTGDYRSPAKAYEAIMTDKDYICSARRVLSALSRNQTEFVGRFLFNHGLASGPFARYGATHGLEMFFIFDTVEATAVNPQTADDRVLVKAFQTTWSIFARTGTAPNSWDRYDVANDNYRILNTPMSSGDHLRKTQCDFWDLQPAP